MDEIVALEIHMAEGPSAFYLTHGRIFHPVDGAELENLVLKHAREQMLFDATSVSLCPTLQCAARSPYFYEGLFALAVERARLEFSDPEGWRRRVAQEIKSGDGLWLTGPPEGS